MIDLRMSEDEKKDFSTPSHEAPKYPYGLEITLNPDVMEKLGIEKPLEVGKKVQIVAVAEVKAVRKNDEQGDSEKYCMELQIKEMDLKEDKEERQDMPTESVMYGG